MVSRDDIDPSVPAAVGWLVDLCARDTTTGREDDGLDVLTGLLASLGARVEVQEVAPGRSNVAAFWGRPRVLFSTHLDTVPPYFPPKVLADRVQGRGACDAKGQAVAQLSAVQGLLAQGLDEVAWLGVVGEETDSIGATAAYELRDAFRECRALINGEPTDLALATGQRGFVHLRLETRGRPAHSGTPEEGQNALWPLLDWLRDLRRVPLAEDPRLGAEVWNVGGLESAGALNVVPHRAVADLSLRPVPGSEFCRRAAELRPPQGRLTEVRGTSWELFEEIPGFRREPVPFGSDAPRLRRLIPEGKVVLAGPGSIRVAHTEEEFLTFADLVAGADLYRRLALYFLESGP